MSDTAAISSSAPVSADNTSSSDESTTGAQQAAASPVVKAATPPPPAPKKYKLKVDGREEELDEESVSKLAQMGRASSKRFQEAAQSRKQSEDFIKMLKEDPASVLTNPAIGIDLRKFAEDYLMKQYEQEKMTPEQRQMKDYEARLQTIRAGKEGWRDETPD